MRAALAALALILGSALAVQAQAPAADTRPARPDELLDCSREYGALSSAESYVRAMNDVASSYFAARGLHARLSSEPGTSEEEILDAWKAQVGAAQTLVRACRCWEQLDRLAYEEQVLAAENTTTKRLKAEIGRTVARPCAKVFAAEAAGSR